MPNEVTVLDPKSAVHAAEMAFQALPCGHYSDAAERFLSNRYVATIAHLLLSSQVVISKSLSAHMTLIGAIARHSCGTMPNQSACYDELLPNHNRQNLDLPAME
jgi:hypothetical protein